MLMNLGPDVLQQVVGGVSQMILNPEGSQFNPGNLVPRNVDRVCAAAQAIPSFQKHDRHTRFLQPLCRRQAGHSASLGNTYTGAKAALIDHSSFCRGDTLTFNMLTGGLVGT